MIAVVENDKCVKIWSTMTCLGDKVKIDARTPAGGEWIEGYIIGYDGKHLIVKTIDGVKYLRYSMIRLIKVILYER